MVQQILKRFAVLETAQPILTQFTVFETVIQGHHFLLYNLLDMSASWSRKWGSSGPTVVPTLRTMAGLFCRGRRHSRYSGYFSLQWLYSVSL